MYDEKSAGKNLFNGCRYFFNHRRCVCHGYQRHEFCNDRTGRICTDFQISIVLTAIQSVINVVTGIIGVANSKKIEKASLCYICGIVLIVFALICNAYSAFSGAFSIFSVIFSLILPLLYFWGALKNRQALQEEQGIVVK